MARIRTIKPAFFRHEGLFEAEQESRLPLRVAFAGLWTAADREGRFTWQPRALKLDCLPYDDIDFSRVLDALLTRGFIVKYTSDDKSYGYIPSWADHQIINNREQASSFPKPNETNTLTRAPRVEHACPTPLSSAQAEGKGREQEGERKGKIDGGVVARATPTKKPSTEALPKSVLAQATAEALWRQFAAAYPAPCGKTASQKFKALVTAGENADPIIAAAPRANPDMPAEQWLEERAWAQLSLLPEGAPKSLISADANALADEIAAIAGQDMKFIEPGWCGAAWRCQQWLDSGYPRELIVAGITSMVAAKRPEKIGNVKYFEAGLARFIAQQTRAVPKVVELKPETVEVTRGKTAPANNSRSGLAAISEVYGEIRDQMQRRDSGTLPDTTLQRISS